MNGILCRKYYNSNENVSQFIPTNRIITVLLLIHNITQASHPGRDKYLTIARRQYYWPTMCIDIVEHVSQCISCAQTKGITQTETIF